MVSTSVSDNCGAALHEYITYAAKQGSVPRVHGNGFIQLDLDGYHRDFVTRLHFWGHPMIPRTTVRMDIHDHVFGFESTCLLGRLFNIRHDIVRHEDGRYLIHTPQTRPGEDTPHATNAACLLPATWGDYPSCTFPARVNTQHRPRVDVLHVGESYHMSPFEFHETYAPEPTVTFVVKTVASYASVPRVLIPFGKEPDHEFNRCELMHPNDLWALIYEYKFLHACS